MTNYIRLMSSCIISILFVTFAVFFSSPTVSPAQEFAVFDAHVHYSEDDWSLYRPEEVLKLFDRAGVNKVMVSSTPDDGTLRLYEYAPTRIVPILRPYRKRSDMGVWTEDLSVLSYVEKRLERGIYRGIGEFHLSADQADSPVVRGVARLAEQRGILLHAHTDDTGVERLLRLYPGVTILWAHAGMSAGPEKIGPLLNQYPKLCVELSLRDSDIAPGGKLRLEWRNLFLGNPERFVVGSDTWISSRWGIFPTIHATIRGWLDQLPWEIAEKIAFKNGLRLVGLDH